MTIPEVLSRFKSWFRSLPESVPLVILMVLVGTASFGLGRLSALESLREPVSVFRPDGSRVDSGQSEEVILHTATPEVSSLPAAVGSVPDSGEVVGSKNSNKYHLPWCTGAQRISEANKIYFKTIADAEAAGYVPAANCPGL